MEETMHATSFAVAATFTLALAFGIAGAVQLVAPGFVRRAYRRWELRPQLSRVIGALELLAACFLAIPNTRLWGVVLAGLLNFLAVVMLLKNREYGWAIPGLAAHIVLAPALLAAATA
jgi:hypothetical protein